MDTKTRLLDSAERAVRMHGYDGFSYADLAADVGIRKASIHHHFPTKADLALALVQRYTGRVAAFLEEANTRPTAAERLRAYIDMYRNALADGDTLCLCVAFSLTSSSLSEQVLAEVEAFHRSSLTWLEAVLSMDDGTIEPAQDAASCMALVQGGQLAARVARSVEPFDNAVASIQARCTP